MDQGFPGQHTTTTTVTTTTTTTQPTIRFDSSYARTLPGILKIVQVVLNLLGFICITVSIHSSHSRGGWFNTVAMGGFWFTGILLVLYLFHIIEKFSKIPWLKITYFLATFPECSTVTKSLAVTLFCVSIISLEFIFCAIWTAFYLLAASLAADYARATEAFGVAAFFGFCAMVAYGYDAWLKYRAAKSGALAQGQHTPKQVSTVTSPAY